MRALAWLRRRPGIHSPICAFRPRRFRAASIIGGCSAPGSGIAKPTCKGKADRAEWNEHAAVINAARDTFARAANSPDKTAPLVAIDALDACAAAADAIIRLYRPAPSAPHEDAAVVAWMRNWLEQSKLPAPVKIGDGFRAVAVGLTRPGLQRPELGADNIIDLRLLRCRRGSRPAGGRAVRV
jgi:hypothetical protein